MDGRSCAVLCLRAITDKLMLTIFKGLVPMFQQHGMPDQLLTDKGSEFRLVAFACHLTAVPIGPAAPPRPPPCPPSPHPSYVPWHRLSKGICV